MTLPVDIATLDKDVTAMKNQLSVLVNYLKKERLSVASVLEKMSNLETSNNYRIQAFEKWRESMEPMQLQMIQLQSRIDVLCTYIDQLKETLSDLKHSDELFMQKFEKVTQLSNSVTSANKEISRLRREFETSLSLVKNDLSKTTGEVDGHTLKLERIFNLKTVIFAIGAAIVGAVTVISIVKDWISIVPVGR